MCRVHSQFEIKGKQTTEETAVFGQRRLYSGSFNRSTREGGREGWREEYVAAIGVVGRSNRESKRKMKKRREKGREDLDVSTTLNFVHHVR